MEMVVSSNGVAGAIEEAIDYYTFMSSTTVKLTPISVIDYSNNEIVWWI